MWHQYATVNHHRTETEVSTLFLSTAVGQKLEGFLSLEPVILQNGILKSYHRLTFCCASKRKHVLKCSNKIYREHISFSTEPPPLSQSRHWRSMLNSQSRAMQTEKQNSRIGTGPTIGWNFTGFVQGITNTSPGDPCLEYWKEETLCYRC